MTITSSTVRLRSVRTDEERSSRYDRDSEDLSVNKTLQVCSSDEDEEQLFPSRSPAPGPCPNYAPQPNLRPIRSLNQDSHGTQNRYSHCTKNLLTEPGP
ncbi:homeobox protein SIX1-like [Tachysurus ichikawai]